jgi:hypothetical protein
MAIDLDPKLWLDQNEGAVKTIVTEGVAGTGCVTVYSGDGTNGIDGLDLTAAGANTDKASAARIIKAILEYMYSYQEALDAADKPTTMVLSRSTTSSGTTMYVTYSVRFSVNTESLEVA